MVHAFPPPAAYEGEARVPQRKIPPPQLNHHEKFGAKPTESQDFVGFSNSLKSGENLPVFDLSAENEL